MAMAPLNSGWTVEMVKALPDDGRRYEVIDGELFMSPGPSWAHGDAAAQLHLLLHAYCHRQGIGHVKIAPQDIEFDERNMVEPDLFVVPLVEGKKPLGWEGVRRLLLAVEILSPATARADRHRKRALYQREGVPEYWIVDLDARLVEVWKPGESRPEILSEHLDWRPVGELPALGIDLKAFFTEVWGEEP
jgi:Uma2 family endonuclease